MTLRSHSKPFEPMLAAPRGELSDESFPIIVQPKYDGIRFVVLDGQVLTRKLEPIPNRLISETLSDPRFNGFDGELIAGDEVDPDVYHTTESVVMSRDGDPSDVTAFVFDDFSHPAIPYADRYAMLKERIDALGMGGEGSIIQRVRSAWIDDVDDLMAAEENLHQLGYEGAIVRDPRGLYKYGRSTESEGALWKMKRFVDDEMLVTEVLEWERNENEDVRTKTGKAKRGHSKAGKVGTGLFGKLAGTSPKWPGERIVIGSSNLPKLEYGDAVEMFMGKLVTFKHQPAGAKNKPRFPVFIRIRDPRT